TFGLNKALVLYALFFIAVLIVAWAWTKEIATGIAWALGLTVLAVIVVSTVWPEVRELDVPDVSLGGNPAYNREVVDAPIYSIRAGYVYSGTITLVPGAGWTEWIPSKPAKIFELRKHGVSVEGMTDNGVRF